MTFFNGRKPLIIVKKGSFLDVAGILDTSLYMFIFGFRFTRMKVTRHTRNDLGNFSLSNFQNNFADPDQAQNSEFFQKDTML